MKLSILSLFAAIAMASAADEPVAKTPEQLRKGLKQRGLQTPAADGSDAGADTGGGGATGCFSGMTTVDVLGKGEISMDSLKIGDSIRDGPNDSFSRVYSFAHMDRDLDMEFLQIFSEGAKAPVELTFNHMIYANQQAVRSETVQVGDVLNDNQKVTEIKKVTRTGVFAPVTESGNLYVDGVKASAYVAVLDHMVAQHAFNHMFFAPQRVACSINFSWCEGETYSEDGFSSYANWAAKLYMSANGLSATMQHLLTVLVVAVLPLVSSAEQFFVSPTASLVLLGYVAYKTFSKKAKIM